MILPFRTEDDADHAVEMVRDHLAGDRVLAYPTETVYGIGGLASEAAVARLARFKGRDPDKPFLLLVADRAMVDACGLVFSPNASALADAFWPGPLTLVLAGGEGQLPDLLRGPEGGIAVRHTSHGLMARLIGRLGRPITSTSANRPGTPPAPGPEWIARIFGPELIAGELLILDGGALGTVPPSTVVDCTGSPPRLVREGALPRAELRRAVGRLAP